MFYFSRNFSQIVFNHFLSSSWLHRCINFMLSPPYIRGQDPQPQKEPRDLSPWLSLMLKKFSIILLFTNSLFNRKSSVRIQKSTSYDPYINMEIWSISLYPAAVKCRTIRKVRAQHGIYVPRCILFFLYRLRECTFFISS
jgi:hypothetical protein